MKQAVEKAMNDIWNNAFPELNKETLEEALKNWVPINQRIGFKEGVKWREKNSYSEDEVFNLLIYFNNYPHLLTISFKDWFEQFKKK